MPSSDTADGADDARLIAQGRGVIRVEAEALAMLEQTIDVHFAKACRVITGARRQLVVTGMGKSGLIARKIAASFTATGTHAIFVHPAEAAHGDLGNLGPGDVLLAISNSGRTPELRPMVAHATRSGVPVIAIGSNPASPLMEMADIALVLPAAREACPENVAPTTSTTLQLALGDALVIAVMDLRGITREHLRVLHPGGTIGLELTPVTEMMHSGEELPLVAGGATIADAISCMTCGRFGIAGVLDGAGALAGVISDGDLRRNFARLTQGTAIDIATRSPRTIAPDMLAAEALRFLNAHKITAAFIVETQAGAPVPLGIVHIHDLLRAGLG